MELSVLALILAASIAFSIAWTYATLSLMFRLMQPSLTVTAGHKLRL